MELEPERAGDVQTLYDALEAGRACEPDVLAAYERICARLREVFGEYAAEYDEIVRDFDARMNELPPPRFHYLCAVAGCGCNYRKRAA